jgi:hypothetical protein
LTSVSNWTQDFAHFQLFYALLFTKYKWKCTCIYSHVLFNDGFMFWEISLEWFLSSCEHQRVYWHKLNCIIKLRGNTVLHVTHCSFKCHAEYDSTCMCAYLNHFGILSFLIMLYVHSYITMWIHTKECIISNFLVWKS